jgi:hypothetical protein
LLGLNGRTHPIWAGSWIAVNNLDKGKVIEGGGKTEKLGKLLDENSGDWLQGQNNVLMKLTGWGVAPIMKFKMFNL